MVWSSNYKTYVADYTHYQAALFKPTEDNDYIIFEDREDAARLLAERLRPILYQIQKRKGIKSIDRSNTSILAIPRGGVVTGDVLASIFGLNLDMIVSRKIGAPDNPELAIGAVMHDGSFFANSDILKILQIPEEYIRENITIQMKEIQRRLLLFKHSQRYDISSKIVILVDDGIATGASIFVAIQWIKKQNPKSLIIAIPVAPKDAIRKLEGEQGVDHVVVIETPEPFRSVGSFYTDFSQVSDDEVLRIMNKYHIG